MLFSFRGVLVTKTVGGSNSEGRPDEIPAPPAGRNLQLLPEIGPNPSDQEVFSSEGFLPYQEHAVEWESLL